MHITTGKIFMTATGANASGFEPVYVRCCHLAFSDEAGILNY